MKLHFVPLFAAGLLALGILAIACGDNGGGNDDPAIRDVLQESVTACNEGDSVRMNELTTASGLACPPDPPNDLEIVSVTIEGDEATAEIILTDNEGAPNEYTMELRKEDGRWLVHGATLQ